MRKTTFAILITLFVSFCFQTVSIADNQAEKEAFPDITLTIPDNPDQVKYLGLKGEAGTPFKVSDIKADILIIELFSMYCPYCQKAAPAVNELYKLMQEKTKPNLKLVIIGIGANNTDLEVDTFRNTFNIEFPLFSDPDMTNYKALAGKGTPGFIGSQKDKDSNTIIFYRKSGAFPDTAEFLKNIISKSGIMQE